MPKHSAYTSRSWEAVFNIALVGSYAVVAAIAILLLISLGMGRLDALAPLAVCGIAFLYLTVAQRLARTHHHAAGCMLVLLYMVLATGIVWSWGVNTPIGSLIFALSIVLAGILLAAWHAYCAAIAAALVLIGVQVASVFNWHNPDTSWMSGKASSGDVIGYCVVFGMLALVSWLYNREMERSFNKARRAGVALTKQKATLKLQVEARTAELRRLQLEEMQQMYRFAELGQLGITLLHDLANHLTTLSLQIESMERTQHSKDIVRAQEIIGYLENIVASTRERLNGGTQKQTFNIVHITSKALAFLRYKAAAAGVKIEWHPPAQNWKYTGDLMSYGQVIAIIAGNAIDVYGAASESSPEVARKVTVTLQRDDKHIIVHISNWGDSISKAKRKQLFKPYHSTKKSGLGIGLYIAKQTVEMQFSGTIAINPHCDHTDFVITLPLTTDAK